jgi:hypothetical protein
MLAIATLATMAACTGSSVVLIPGTTPAGDAAATALDGPIRDAGAADPADADVDVGGGDSGQVSADARDAADSGQVSADARDAVDASNDDGADAADAPADMAADMGGAVMDASAADAEEDVFNPFVCPAVAGMWVSQEDHACGVGQPPCRWRLSLALDGVFTWSHDGLVEVGTYWCKDPVVQILVNRDPVPTMAWYDPTTGVLKWDFYTYAIVP